MAPSSAFVAADFRIYKDGSATEKTTTNGITVTSPFDSVVGRHLIEIDTSNATGDSGFWASGSAYFVEFNTAKTVSGQTVSGLEVGSFSLELQTARLAAITHTGAILPRVTLVDTCTTNTDMRGTDNAALAATALSTAVWTSTIAGRIDATISSRSTYAGADTAGITTLLSRIGSAITITGGAVTAVLDPASLAQFVTYDTGQTTAAAGSVAKLSQGSGSGGGDATLAKQNEILAAIQGSEVIQVASPNVNGNLVLTQGDNYDGVANPKATWTVTTDYTSGWSVTLTIRNADDAIVYSTSGTVASATSIQVAIACPTGLTMTGCPGQWQGKFDVELTKNGSKKTIALGVCYINEDQTR